MPARGGADPIRVQPPASRTRRRLPEVLVGLLLVAGCTLGAVVTWTNTNGRALVLMVARPVAPGAVLGEADVATNAEWVTGMADVPPLAVIPGRIDRRPCCASDE